MPAPIPPRSSLARTALVGFPRPDTLAAKLLEDWLKARGVTVSPAAIDVVTLHYQYTRLAANPDRYTLTAVVKQRANLVEAMLGNWQGEPAAGYTGLHYGDWAGLAPLEAVVVVKRLDPLSAWSNASPYLIFNGLYRHTASGEYSPATRLNIRAEDFQAYLWETHLHARLKVQLDSYWTASQARYRRALKIAFINACNRQVRAGELSEAARVLAWQAAAIVAPSPRPIKCWMLNVYGYRSTSLLCIKPDDNAHVLLYLPGNASPLHEFSDMAALKQWFARQCQEPAKREWLQKCFSPADWEDGLDYSGLRTALEGLGVYPRAHHLPINYTGFATSGVWSPEETIDFAPQTNSRAIAGDLFSHLAERQRQRSYDEADYLVVTNQQIDRRRLGNYLNIALGMLAPMALVVPELIPVLVLGGLSQFGIGLDQAVNGHSLEEKAQGVENQVFGLFNAAPLTLGVERATQVFRYLRPGFSRPSQLAQLLGESTPATETIELLPAEWAFHQPGEVPSDSSSPVLDSIDEDLAHRFEGAFDSDTGVHTEPVVLDLRGNSFIKVAELALLAPSRWIIASGSSQTLTRLLDLQRAVTDAQRTMTLQQLGIELEYPLDYSHFDSLVRTPIPHIVSSLWVGDKVIAGSFLDALVHNASALHGTGFTYQLFLSRQYPSVYQTNLRLLQANAPHLNVFPLEDEGFYQAFTRSAYFPQYQAAMGSAGAEATNFSSATDILRYRLLKHFGGLYLDADDRLLNAASPPGSLPLANQPLRTTADGLLLSPPVSNEQLGMDIKYNSSAIGSHPHNPTLDAISDEMLRRYQQDPTFYASRPDWRLDPVAFNAYARRLNKLTGPGVLNDVIDARLPWLKQLREMCRLLVSPVYNIHSTLDLTRLSQLLREHVPLDQFIEVGRAHSWQHT